MDSNQTRFHLLFGGDWPKWRQSLSDPSVINWDEARQEITLAKRAFRFTAGKGDLVFTPEHRRGAAQDRFGNWYWIADSENELLVNSSGDNVTAHFWSNRDGVRCDEKERGDFAPAEKPPPCPPLQLRGLAVTEDHYLVVGTVEPAGLLIFDLHSGVFATIRKW